MKSVLALALTAVLLVGCDDAEPTPPAPTPTRVPYNNMDPRKGEVRLDRTCGFWSCQETTMRCMASTLILTGADGSVTRVPDADECKPDSKAEHGN